MGLKDDIRRFEQLGEEFRMDLDEFIREGEMGASDEDTISLPVRIVDLPEIAYDPLDKGRVGMTGDSDAQPDQGDPVEIPRDPQQGDEPGDGDEAGEDGAEHDEYYEMDPEEFADLLDDEFDLDLEPKGKKVAEETEGPLKDVARQGPPGTLRMKEWFTEGLKRKLATAFDEEYVREALRVDGWEPDRVFEWAREEAIPVSKRWIENAYGELSTDERTRWASIEEMEANVEREQARERIRREGVESIPLRREDREFRHPEIVREYQKNVVVVNIRDVSGSMGSDKRELVERTFAPLDWYLQGKYERAEFVYIAHNADAWEVDRYAFFHTQSKGGTKISSAYELVSDTFADEYPWREWNRYVFAAGDGENSGDDSEQQVVPLMEAIDANLHAYVQVQPGRSRGGGRMHADVVEEHFDVGEDVAVERVTQADAVPEAIQSILSTEDS